VDAPIVPGSGTGSYQGIKGTFKMTATLNEVEASSCKAGSPANFTAQTSNDTARPARTHASKAKFFLFKPFYRHLSLLRYVGQPWVNSGRGVTCVFDLMASRGRN